MARPSSHILHLAVSLHTPHASARRTVVAPLARRVAIPLSAVPALPRKHLLQLLLLARPLGQDGRLVHRLLQQLLSIVAQEVVVEVERPERAVGPRRLLRGIAERLDARVVLG